MKLLDDTFAALLNADTNLLAKGEENDQLEDSGPYTATATRGFKPTYREIYPDDLTFANYDEYLYR